MWTSGTTIMDFTALAKWINAYCTARSRVNVIPEDKGRLPYLTPRQFRRTLAWFGGPASRAPSSSTTADSDGSS
ncbi:hypothetical protein ABZZ80_08455 [Streptomyces sp. NPDC006356]